MKKVAVVMGSQSDLPIMQKCFEILKEFQIDFEVQILSAHRTPQATKDFASNAIQNGFSVLIAAAGKSAHLAGVLASLTPLPVIAIPIKTSDLGGMDSLLSSVQMPSGIPVACVGINAAENAGLLAIQILATNHPDLYEKILNKRQKEAQKILQNNATLTQQIKDNND
ncbi:5-(carboxyamino)imidazole ribonucleotide mutase [Helicobacter enhydrae]|uniref:N5-carboxyaminoimidazole ribonucleotide mutase n=1 Tax=Helicobacter enhydrae TaxID=222136 RepID=A0A1B1U5L3_9HELI|nr:5-(carboxyamino)imidazole ribonucleotide mutase [Helicobacter enhydrae]ANV98040.1 5-(carboxyamino)imidazole ribonucleotide mutase [Helicobacter enhydrae]